jgi:hypothetical protein
MPDSMRRLKPHQQDLLDRIVRHGGLPTRDVDGRILRALVASGVVEVVGTRVKATAAGRGDEGTESGPAPPRGRLNERQEGLLRMLLRDSEAAQEEVDGRVMRSLLSRGLAMLQGEVVTPTTAGRAYFEQEAPAVRRRGRKRKENARSAVIRRAVRTLESAIPRGAEVLVGNIMAAADDVVDGFRKHARMLDQRDKA